MEKDPLLDYRGQTLLAVAKTGSLTAAAKQLFITQPAVSQQLNAWEKELGFRLLDHQGKKVTLTPAAKRLVDYLNFLAHENQKMLDELKRQTAPLRLGATLSIGSFLLPQVLTEMIAQNRPVTTQIGNTQTLLNQIQRGELDAALVEGDFDHQRFDWEEIGLEPFALFGSQAIDRPVALPELFDYPLLIRESGSGTRQILEKWLQAQGSALTDFKQIIEIGSPATIITLLKDGVGISFMYRALVEDDLQSGKLFEWDLNELSIRHALYLVTAKNSFFKDQRHQLVKICRQVR
ncbi:LysR family transcriptional regulator [Limosilactobacillus mucosae]|uniref:LysR family transcriptional regulator n=1 Tax=Limosilactobacillus mucosae TaxID=97478 RepID=A0AAJ1MAT5_LIMMU|nr:LysR family transcriptional regulator [Limosilactobacillus mucosae]MDD6893430.1 LysR family transcriptional regulator [Lactobacillus sp.]MDC2829364.1 LysR family transcriptional regulator [Limosilactobacillus mucosae]MDC2837047.1 LysR family transcriptional regulator [Limosilactobacillus mucosae]MDC2849262.1 LysR family transcriptional regulator [Limosilactobacillus mucosae]MDC2852959.1 LysR family transcriptional regulator [Limosilactobacillus mucosae]